MEKHINKLLMARPVSLANNSCYSRLQLLRPALFVLLSLLGGYASVSYASQADDNIDTNIDASIETESTAYVADNASTAGETIHVDDIEEARQKGLFLIYRSNMLKKTYRHIVYPQSAIDKDHEGIVVLKLTLTRSGEITKIDYESRARYNSLNKAAYKAVKQAMPFPAVPKQVDGESFELLMPIKFRLQS